MTRGTPTNGHLPCVDELLRPSREAMGRSNFFLCEKLRLLVFAHEGVDKCDDSNDNHAKIKQVLKSDHLTHLLPCGGKGRFPSAVSGVPLGLSPRGILAYFRRFCKKYYEEKTDQSWERQHTKRLFSNTGLVSFSRRSRCKARRSG